VTVELERTYGAAEDAARVARALEADRPRELDTVVDGARLTFRLRAPSAASARATLEDLLACLGSAERTLGLSSTTKGGAREGSAPS